MVMLANKQVVSIGEAEKKLDELKEELEEAESDLEEAESEVNAAEDMIYDLKREIQAIEEQIVSQDLSPALPSALKRLNCALKFVKYTTLHESAQKAPLFKAGDE